MCERRSAGGPLTSSRRSGRNTLTSGLKATSRTPLDGGAVGAHALRRLGRAGGRAEADGQLVWFVPVEQLDGDAGRLGAEAHQLALVASAGRAPGAAVVDGLQKVALAGSVGSVDDAQGAAEGGLRARVAAKVAHLHGQDTRPPRRHTFRRIGMIRYTKSPVVGGFDHAGAQRADQLQHQLLGLDALEPVLEELGVEADLEHLAVEGHRDRLAGLADVGGLGGDGERALAEAQPQGRVLLRQQADAAHHLAELGGRHAQFVVDRVGQQLAVVGELAVDQARGQHRVAELEDHLVGPAADRQRVGVRAGGDADQLLQCPRRDVDLERALDGGLERGLLDAQAVGVGGHHPQLRSRGRHQDPGQDRPGLVPRGRSGDAADGRHEGLRRAASRGCRARARAGSGSPRRGASAGGRWPGR